MNGPLDALGDATLFFDVATKASIFTERSSVRVRGRFGPTRTEKEMGVVNLGNVAAWGASNDWPQRVVEEMRSSDLLRPLARKHAKRMIGQGLVYGTTTIDERTGEEKMKVMRHLEIDRWLKRTNISMFLYGSWIDWVQQGNIFPELQMDLGGQVAGLYHQDATRCRLSLKDDYGRIPHCYIGGDWASGGTESAKGTFKLPAVDPFFDVAGQIRASKQGRFIMPIRLLVDDQDYYGEAPWHGLIHGGYLDLARAIIAAKKYLTENLSHIRYHVEIGSEFWALNNPGWDQKKPEEKKAIKAEVVKAFTKWATGMDKAGRTLVTDMLTDDIAGKKEYRSLWKITPIKLEIPTGAYVEDSSEVDAKIIRAFMDQSLFGATPSKDRNSSGSGSDKRIAHTHELIDNQIDCELILSPLDVVAEVNGWHEKYGNGQMLKFWFRGYHSATLDRTLGAVSESDPTKKVN